MRERKKITRLAVSLTGFLAIGLASLPAPAESPLSQWKAGLSGALLTAYSGSVISSSSTLTTLRLCRDGRFQLDREGSWNAGGAAMGANQSRITGRWDVIESGGQIVVTYATDTGDQGSYPVRLQNDGRVNLGGVAYAAQRGGAGC